jgi:hypothetical protein
MAGGLHPCGGRSEREMRDGHRQCTSVWILFEVENQKLESSGFHFSDKKRSEEIRLGVKHHFYWDLLARKG